MPETHGLEARDHWYTVIFCEHGFRKTVEVTPVWTWFLPSMDDCPEARREREVTEGRRGFLAPGGSAHQWPPRG